MNKMLVVEDDILSQKMMKRIFKNDFVIDICESANEYYNQYEKLKYDIIIMDVSIRGDKNGLDLIKEIKESSVNLNTPIICLTAHAQLKTRATAIESGTDLFMTKPVANRILRDAVTSLILRSA